MVARAEGLTKVDRDADLYVGYRALELKPCGGDRKTMMSVRDLLQQNKRPVSSFETRPNRFMLVATSVFVCFGVGLWHKRLHPNILIRISLGQLLGVTHR
jgi:hypothetical protein